MKRFTRLFVIALCAFALPAQASPQGAEKFIDSLSTEVISLVQNDKLSAEKRTSKFHSMFEKNIDFDWISGFVLGKHKRTATPEQLKNYTDAYRKFIIKSYTKRFEAYAGEKFEIKSSREESKGKYLLTTEIIRPKEANVLVDYKVKKVGKSYRIYDIVVEGVSLITTQRSEFNSVIARKGLDFLIEQLEKKANA